jgi:hypothetical protein
MKFKTATRFIKYLMSVALLFVHVNGYSQSKVITGTVNDNENLPLPGVNVTIKGAKVQAVTDLTIILLSCFRLLASLPERFLQKTRQL